MRKRFEQQLTIEKRPIAETVIPIRKRNGPLPALFIALKEIFVTPEWNEKVFKILDQAIMSKNNHTGRPGMDLWQIFVLAQVRLCKNMSYDDLHYIANSDKIIRQLIGIESELGFEEEVIGYQRIKDNVGLLTDDTVKELNEVIVAFGHNEVFKKKEEEALRLKTDSYVVESNVHFPTDYNLLWDASRKATDMVKKLRKQRTIPGWRKVDHWSKQLKSLMRALGRASGSGGKGKEKRVKDAAQNYLAKATELLQKLALLNTQFQPESIQEWAIMYELRGYMQLIEKHIDLVDRRILKGETIPHGEKMFSIFEDYTEWITKGKKRPSVELGKKVGITTDHFDLIIDYQVMEHQADSEVVPELVERVLQDFNVDSWSFDKGYWHKENKALLAERINTVVMPKKGKPSKQEIQEERTPLFRKLRYKHSAVESNINELEHRGLDRCPDRGFDHFKRYVGLGVCAYNLRKIGAELLAQQWAKEKRRLRKAA